jgi:hypothetical protein
MLVELHVVPYAEPAHRVSVQLWELRGLAGAGRVHADAYANVHEVRRVEAALRAGHPTPMLTLHTWAGQVLGLLDLGAQPRTRRLVPRRVRAAQPEPPRRRAQGHDSPQRRRRHETRRAQRRFVRAHKQVRGWA